MAKKSSDSTARSAKGFPYRTEADRSHKLEQVGGGARGERSTTKHGAPKGKLGNLAGAKVLKTIEKKPSKGRK